VNQNYVGRRAALAFVAIIGWLTPEYAKAEAKAVESPRIVTLGAAVTETVIALGASDHIVGVDSTSRNIITDRKVTNLGFYRRVSAVGILSVGPTMVLANHDSGPPPIFEQLRQAKVRVIRLPKVISSVSALEQIERISAALGKTAEGQKLIDNIEKQLKTLSERRAALPQKPRILFVYARGPGALLVGGKNTPADVMIDLVGGANVAGAFEGFKPLSPEALLANPPEILLMTTHGFDALGGMKGLQRQPILSRTTAVKTNRVVVRPARRLLSFGPDFAARALALLDEVSSPVSVSP